MKKLPQNTPLTGKIWKKHYKQTEEEDRRITDAVLQSNTVDKLYGQHALGTR